MADDDRDPLTLELPTLRIGQIGKILWPQQGAVVPAVLFDGRITITTAPADPAPDETANDDRPDPA